MDLNLIVFNFLLMLISYVKSDNNQLQVTVTPQEKIAKIGDKVQFECAIIGNRQKKFSEVWKHGEEMISERCSAYDDKKYKLQCTPNDWEQAKKFTIIINKVSWADRGEWTCVYMLNLKHVNLTIIQPPKLQPTKIEMVQEKKPSAAASTENGGNSLVRVPSRSISGAGRANNPYNLRGGESIDIYCKTKCSYPSVNIIWSRNNISIDPNVNSEGNTIKVTPINNEETTDECTDKLSNGMFITSSVARINCSKPQIIGLNKIQCYTESNDDKKQVQARQSIYVLCPEFITTTPAYKGTTRPGGERPMRLTSGEVVGIAVGTSIFLILLFIGCMTLNKKKKSNEQGLIRGMRV